MQVSREAYRATAIVLGLVASVTIGHGTPAAAEEDPAVDSAAALEDGILALRIQAAYDSALLLARDLLAKRRADPGAQPYEVGDAERLVATLERVVGLSREEQQKLADADFSTIRIEKLCSEMNFLEASAAAQEQLTLRRELLGVEHPDVATSLDHLACVLHDGHGAGQDIRYGDLNPESMLREALGMRRALLEPQHPDIATSADHVASLLADRGDYSAETEELYREALAIRRQTGIPPSDLIESINDLLILLVEQGKPNTDHEIDALAREAKKLVRSSKAPMRCHVYIEPERTSMPEREYPPDALRGNREGTVHVAALVGKDGKVKYAAVTMGVHESLNRDAVDVVKRCRFKPGRCDGRPVAIWYPDIPMEYMIH